MADMLVLAACEGMVMPYTRDNDGTLTPLGSSGRGVLSSLDALREMLEERDMVSGIPSIMLVGSLNDIAWVRAALPEALGHRITAEINYPLVPAWFRLDSGTAGLTQAISHVLSH